jgi:CBS domain containing-hemolysin-like protein
MDPSTVLWGLLLTALLIFLNGFFVAAEFAIVKVRDTQLRERAQVDPRARLSQHIQEHIDSYLSACQVGITGASLALGWIGEPVVATLIRPLFAWLEATSETLFHVLSFAVAFGLITYLHIVVGEQAPKYFAIQRALPTTLWSAYPLHFFRIAMRPFISFVNSSANLLLARVGIRRGDELEAMSEEELKMSVATAARKGVLQESERQILHNVLDFADTLVRQVMVPRTEIVAVDADASLQEVVGIAERHPYTRYPVYRGDLDHVSGIVHLRDLVAVSPEELQRTRVTQIMRRVAVVPETMRLDRALAEMRRQRMQLFVVIDEFGGTAGLVTAGDLLAELVGEVQDEFDRQAPQIRPADDGSFVIDGLTPLQEVRERLGLDLEDEPYDTVGGLVFGRLGRVGKLGDAVDVEGVRFEVTAMDALRIAQVRARRSGRQLARS